MKAVYFEEHGDLSVLKYGEVPVPEPAPGWVRLRVKACGLNYLDIFSRRGMPGIKVELPGITGGDCAGVIDKLGDGVEGWRVGERVLPVSHHVDWEGGQFEMLGETRNGAMAEYCTVRASQLMRLPDSVADEKAAALPCAYGTAYRMLHTRGGIKTGETILVLGASGGVGTACILLAKLTGCKVIAAAGSEDKCERLRALGADETINYATTKIDRYIRETTGTLLRGGGVDVVVNFTAGDTWAASMRCVKRFGRLLCCGGTGGYSAVTDIPYLFMSEMNIIGSTGWTVADQRACLDLVASGRLDPPIDRVCTLADGIDAVRALEERAVVGKVIVKP
ncbi:zinc-binding dehydrogenase [Rhodopseudomonas sp. HC1]|uniref:quinone oxidoreductase family protein n=1 Tax=Rhodopseudomonas infernalis TaxID=2897386 RepID=UPI001EE8B864|nr:zinc-binding dehydrogenase [Rhodopseudomonas infernalis]MCG6203759.1 zinc-binding dehydrogenase [Rhodopseudomonas infernalis]